MKKRKRIQKRIQKKKNLKWKKKLIHQMRTNQEENPKNVQKNLFQVLCELLHMCLIGRDQFAKKVDVSAKPQRIPAPGKRFVTKVREVVGDDGYSCKFVLM